MAGGKTNTQRIETLESQAANQGSRLDVIDLQIENLEGIIKKCVEAAEAHGTRIVVVEQQHMVVADLKAAVAAIAPIREELVGLRKDVEGLQSWKADQKKEKEEAARRLWSFGPNLAAAAVAGAVTILGVLLNVGLTYYLARR